MSTTSTPELRSEIDSKVKVITLTETPRKYTRKNKTNDKAKELVDQMIQEQENELKNDETKCIISGIVNELVDASLVKETINETTNETISEPQIEVKNNLFTDEVFEKMIDDAVKNDPNSKTIRERTLVAIFDAHNYKKCSKGKFITDSDKVTGKLLDINQMEDDQLCILDFDIPHNTDKYNKEAYQTHIIHDLLPKDTPVLITAHGGVHAYVNRYGYPLKSNRLVASKKIPFQFFTVDVFAQIDKHKMSDGKKNGIKENRVMLPDSIIHDDDYDKTQIEYSYPAAPEGFWERSNLPSLWDILNAWNVDLRQDDYVKEERVIQADGTSIPMNEELINKIAEGFKGIQIHNYATKSSDGYTLI
ncbi:MAG: hypothetical protein EZS28_002030 [Streblomastix strix]|uniref:Uncharacterized protein n=1 Tax=Streblomastix strix TaxID=222440 RepID=A0A5J4X5A1_9EUKA|nr:MAG: hypothetical protein EZS28_002030 [Streblomastix strix]